MYYIVYRTTNLINGKVYLGIHKQENLEFDGYYGSGLLLNRALEKYSKNYFKRDTLFVYETLDEARQKEKDIVTEAFCERDDNYNISVGGTGGNTIAGYTKEQRGEINEKRKKTVLKNGSNIYTGEKLERAKKRMISCRIQPNNSGRIYQGEALSNIKAAANSRIGKYRWYTNGEISKLVKIEQAPADWVLGRGDDFYRRVSHTKDSKEKISNKIKGDICYNNGLKNLKLKIWQDPPEGYTKGMLQTHDKMWITDGQKSVFIKKLDPIPDGWKKGRTTKKVKRENYERSI